MLQIIHCNGCGKSGKFFLHLEVTTKTEACNLHHFHSQETTYHFCSLDCLKKWQDSQEIFDKGIPCPSCIDYKTGESTGFSSGFPQNGPCHLCNGEKRLKETKCVNSTSGERSRARPSRTEPGKGRSKGPDAQA